jgi:hypothetical protein
MILTDLVNIALTEKLQIDKIKGNFGVNSDLVGKWR